MFFKKIGSKRKKKIEIFIHDEEQLEHETISKYLGQKHFFLWLYSFSCK